MTFIKLTVRIIRSGMGSFYHSPPENRPLESAVNQAT